MKKLFASRPTSSGANDYAGVVLSSPAEIRQLSVAARMLMQQDDPMLDPEFFLASVSSGWKPRVAAVYRAGQVVAILYTKERVISGLSTGVVYGDGSLGSILLGDQKHSFRMAMETLLACPGIRGVRLRILHGSHEHEAIQQVIASQPFDAQYSHINHNDSILWKYHAHLPLPDTYDGFLTGLGGTTRHNFRYYRRRFEASGHRFIERLTMEELRSAARELDPQSKFMRRMKQTALVRDLNTVALTRQPLAIGLKHQNGEWLSVMGGWYQGRRAVLLFQCNNDRNFGSSSLSVVLRAYLIELLIRQGVEELVIWSDTGPPLSRYVNYPPTIGVSLDVPTSLWRLARALISTIGPRLPGRFAAAAQWVA